MILLYFSNLKVKGILYKSKIYKIINLNVLNNVVLLLQGRELKKLSFRIKGFWILIKNSIKSIYIINQIRHDLVSPNSLKTPNLQGQSFSYPNSKDFYHQQIETLNNNLTLIQCQKCQSKDLQKETWRLMIIWEGLKPVWVQEIMIKLKALIVSKYLNSDKLSFILKTWIWEKEILRRKSNLLLNIYETVKILYQNNLWIMCFWVERIQKGDC